MPLRKVCILTLAGMASLAASAQAQSMNTSSASYQAGYGLSLHQMQTAIDPSTRDANGNRVLVDGVMSIGSDNSVYSYSKTLGAGDSYSGAGALGGASAIGNNLQVTVQGNYNTVIVNSTQTNNGNVTATANGTTVTGEQGTLNGQVNF
ncbi:holdfast anchoring protein HfaA [Asticcacaulis benevestitus]|nr:holdfast anchoring protein HfaA [Asticcacaulis benevestitus]